jgi:hypothetical protein
LMRAGRPTRGRSLGDAGAALDMAARYPACRPIPLTPARLSTVLSYCFQKLALGGQ